MSGLRPGEMQAGCAHPAPADIEYAMGYTFLWCGSCGAIKMGSAWRVPSSVVSGEQKALAYDKIARAYRLGTGVENIERCVTEVTFARALRDEAMRTRDEAVAEGVRLRAELAGLRPSETSADEAAEDTLVRLGQCPQRGCELAAGHHGEHFARPPFKHLDERAIERARALLLENDRLRAEVEALRELRCGDDIRAPNPQAAAQACSAAETPGAAPPRDCGEDDDDDGWTVNGRPVAPRDVDHGNESENPWTVNGAPIPAAFDHAECRAKLELERERYRRALGLLVDVSGVARKVVGYVDHEAETGR